MNIATSNNINSDPVVATADSSSHEYYPSAPVELIDDDDTPQQQPNPFATVSPCASSDPSSNFASAQVVGSDIFTLPTTVIATPLNPWFKPTTTEVIHYDNLTASNNPSSSASNPSSSIQISVLPPSSVATTVVVEEAFHKKVRRRRRRRMRMAVSGATGFVVGSLFAGPIGAIVGAATGATVARAASKAGERRKDKRVQRQVVQMQEEQNRENIPV